MSDSDGDKIFPPTPQRRERARRDGQVARSQLLAQSLTWLAFLLALRYGGAWLWSALENAGAELWSGEAWVNVTAAQPLAGGRSLLARVGLAVLPWCGLLALLTLATQVVQTGWRFHPERLSTGWDRALSGSRGSPGERWAAALACLPQLAVIVGVVVWRLGPRWRDWADLAQAPVKTIAVQLSIEVLSTGIYACGALVALGALDYAIRWWRHERSLWMTREELEEELRHERRARPAAVRSRASAGPEAVVPTP